MGRGQLTKEVKSEAVRVLGREITLEELRLMPYVQYTMMNEQRLDPQRINEAERKVLARWRKEGRVEGGAGGMKITKEFWDAMGSILFLSYVAYDE